MRGQSLGWLFGRGRLIALDPCSCGLWRLLPLEPLEGASKPSTQLMLEEHIVKARVHLVQPGMAIVRGRASSLCFCRTCW